MKHMTMPDVKIVRFEANDIIVTSDPNSINPQEGYTPVPGGAAPERNSLWD